MAKVNVVIVDATGNKEQKVGLPDDVKCGIIMVKLVEKIKLPSVGPDGNPISYKFIHKVTGRQLLESQTLAEAGIKDGDVLRLQPEITAGAFCTHCGVEIKEGDTSCPNCGAEVNEAQGSCPNDENSVEQPTVDVSKFTKVKRQPANYATVEQKAEELSNKLSKGSTFFPIGGIISGILSVIFGIIMFGKDVGYYEVSSSYGGDAYTGIQNAAAQTANNVKALSEITKNGFAFFLIAVGLIAIFYFASKLNKK